MSTPRKPQVIESLERRHQLLLRAIKTSDGVGMVLRLHLATEVLLEVHVEAERGGAKAEFVPSGRFFGDKLSLSVAFGLPVPLARVCKHLNQMRNEVAHPKGVASEIEPDAVRKFARMVHRLKEEMDDYFVSPVDELDSQKSAQIFGYRDEGDLADLLAVFFEFNDHFWKWIRARQAQLMLAQGLLSS